ncbi:glutamate racemase [Actinobacillus equuli]|nr:glutamate racemase [Actinobacillus equuli]
MVVVACNTASTVVLPALREKFTFPIVGTVPAIKPAAAVSETKTIGLLATKGTVERPYVAELIEKYAKDCVVEKIGSTTLVELVEEKYEQGKLIKND